MGVGGGGIPVLHCPREDRAVSDAVSKTDVQFLYRQTIEPSRLTQFQYLEVYTGVVLMWLRHWTGRGRKLESLSIRLSLGSAAVPLKAFPWAEIQTGAARCKQAKKQRERLNKVSLVSNAQLIV